MSLIWNDTIDTILLHLHHLDIEVDTDIGTMLKFLVQEVIKLCENLYLFHFFGTGKVKFRAYLHEHFVYAPILVCNYVHL